MAAKREEIAVPDLGPLIDYLGVEEVLRQIGRDKVAAHLEVEDILTAWTSEQMEELIRLYQQTWQTKP
jgi:hypothetical protein